MAKSKKLSIKIITLFPNFIGSFVDAFGIVKRAIANKLLEVQAVDHRAFGLGERKVVDDRPYGGGVGMVLRADVMLAAIRSACKSKISAKGGSASGGKDKGLRIILLCPQGKRFEQKDAERLAQYDELILVSGRYEGFDERIRKFVDEEISIGDYVLMGGELPALVIAEAVIRLRSGILGKDESSENESFTQGMLEYPQYTKPERLEVGSKKHEARKKRIMKVPSVLLTGHHANIDKFRKEESGKRTKKRRPDLLA